MSALQKIFNEKIQKYSNGKKIKILLLKMKKD